MRLIDEAKKNPGGWVYQIEGNWHPSEAIPPTSIIAAWKVDSVGRLTGEYQSNPNFRKKE